MAIGGQVRVFTNFLFRGGPKLALHFRMGEKAAKRYNKALRDIPKNISTKVAIKETVTKSVGKGPNPLDSARQRYEQVMDPAGFAIKRKKFSDPSIKGMGLQLAT